MPGRQDLIADAKKLDIAQRVKEVLEQTKVKEVVKASKAEKRNPALFYPQPDLDPLMRQFEEALAKGDAPLVALIREQIQHFNDVRS